MHTLNSNGFLSGSLTEMEGLERRRRKKKRAQVRGLKTEVKLTTDVNKKIGLYTIS